MFKIMRTKKYNEMLDELKTLRTKSKQPQLNVKSEEQRIKLVDEALPKHIYKRKGRYVVTLTKHNKGYHIGSFGDLEEAKTALNTFLDNYKPELPKHIYLTKNKKRYFIQRTENKKPKYLGTFNTLRQAKSALKKYES